MSLPHFSPKNIHERVNKLFDVHFIRKFTDLTVNVKRKLP